MIVPFAYPALALVAALALGTAIDRALGRSIATAELAPWILRALFGLTAVLALALHPVALVLLALLAIGARGASTEEGSHRALAVFAAILLLVLVLRPAAPIYWDEYVWLAKARVGADPWALRNAALDPASSLIPRGYPTLAPLATALLAFGRIDVPSLVGGSAGLSFLALASALALLPRADRGPWLAALATMPLVWIHARSAYVDLTVGAFALAIAAALARSCEGDRRALAGSLAAAFVVAGLKDEGAGHVLAVAVAHVAIHRKRSALRDATLTVLAALVSFGTWRTLLAVHGVHNGDHAFDAAGVENLGALGIELVRSLIDVRSWGLAWPLAVGVGLASIRRAELRGPALAWFLQLVVLSGAIVLGSERLQVFALSGTLMNRLLIQLAPIAAWSVVTALRAPPRPT